MTEIATAFTSGATLPADPEDGDRHYWTGAGRHEWFTYDDGRSKWLSDRVIEYVFANASGESAGYVTMDMGRASSATAGYLPDVDLVITGARARQNYTHATQAYTLHADDVAVSGAQLTMLGVHENEDDSWNADVASGAVVACKATRASTAEHAVTFTARRKVS